MFTKKFNFFIKFRTSIFPVSGALQLKISGAKAESPISSQMCAYSRFVRPAPYLKNYYCVSKL